MIAPDGTRVRAEDGEGADEDGVDCWLQVPTPSGGIAILAKAIEPPSDRSYRRR